MPRPLVAAIALLAAQPSCRDPQPAEAPAEPPAKVTVTAAAPRLESFTDRRDEPMRFTLEFTARDIVQVPGRDAWRATDRARIVSVHAP